MRAKELQRFAKTKYLNAGHAEILARIQPLFVMLIDELIKLPDGAEKDETLAKFRACVEGLNIIGDEIETVERECVCDALYAIGEIVGLDPKSSFVEQWRGDW